MRNNSGNPESLKKKSWQLENSSTNVSIVREDLLRVFTGYFVYGFVFEVISEKSLCSKDFTKVLREILYENNHKSSSYKFRDKSAYIPALSFRRNQNQESNFQQVGDLVTRNISLFRL